MSSRSSTIDTTFVLPPDIAKPLERSWTEAEAFAYCSALTKSHYENFPVGSVLMPAALQPAIHSLYAFMRTADDFADENRSAGDEEQRLAYLRSWDHLLTEAEHGKARHPVFIAVARTLETYKLPVQWLRDLLHAFTMDVTVRRYATYADVLNYCRYSANPVGRLILTLSGYRDEERHRQSDAICSALQLANHWQDVAVDLKKDRIYLPQEDMYRFGVSEDWLFASSKAVSFTAGPGRDDENQQATAGFRRLMAFQVARARELFRVGEPLPGQVRGRLRWELRLTWQGGMRILDKIEAAGYDVFRHRPTVTKADWFMLLMKTIGHSLLGRRPS